MVAEPFAIPDGEESMVVLDEDGLKVTAFMVDHPPIEPAVGFRFDYHGRSAVISGDTLYTPALVRAAAGRGPADPRRALAELLKLVEDAARDAGLAARRQDPRRRPRLPRDRARRRRTPRARPASARSRSRTSCRHCR